MATSNVVHKTPVIYGSGKRSADPETNHIVVQIDRNILDLDGIVLRITKCSTVAEYEAECASVYPEWRPDGIHVFYNAAKWHERLVTDIIYKNFKNIALQAVKPGLWTMKPKNPESSIDDDDIISFVDKKICSYYEDEDDNISLLDRLRGLHTINFKPSDHVTWNYNMQTTISIPQMEKTKDGEYIPTQTQLLSFVLYAIQTVMFPIDKESKVETTTVDMDVCDITGNVILPKNEFAIPEVRYIVSRLLGWDGVYPFNVFVEKIVNADYYQRSLVQMSGLTHKVVSYTSLSYDVLDDAWTVYDPFEANYQSVDDIQKIHDMQIKARYDDINMAYNSIPNLHNHVNVEFLKSELEKGNIFDESARISIQQLMQGKNTMPLQESFMLYKNVVTNKIEKLQRVIYYLVEFEPISDIDIKTTFGAHLFHNIQQITQSNVDIVVDDIFKFMEVLSRMFKDIPLFKRDDTGSFQVATNRQRELTRIFVDEFKKDDIETPAYMVVEKLSQFLNKYMDPVNINQTQMSMDLVELGVKKVRKTRGNMYGIICPSEYQIQSLTLRNLAK